MLFDSAFQKKVDLDGDTLKVMLLADYTPADTHQYLSQVKAAGTEAVGTGYTAGGKTLTGVTWTRTGKTWTLDCADVSWDTTDGSLDAAWAVVYDSTPGTDATNPVIGWVNLDGAGGTVSSSNGTFSLLMNAAGLLTFTAN
jgi:hypothetical protein